MQHYCIRGSLLAAVGAHGLDLIAVFVASSAYFACIECVRSGSGRQLQSHRALAAAEEECR